MGLRLVHLAGAALTFVVAGGFVCNTTTVTPQPYPTPNVITVAADPDASAGTQAARRNGACGELGLPCCEGDACNGRTTCLEGSCVSCGTAGALRCNTGESCDPWTQPNESTDLCDACGSDNEPCCAGADSDYCREGQVPPVGCFAVGETHRCSRCAADGGMCPVILRRGDAGMHPAGHYTLCGPGRVANDAGACVACGSRGAPCCRDARCVFPFACSRDGVCAAGDCGHPGQPCCRNNRCVFGRCSLGTCRR